MEQWKIDLGKQAITTGLIKDPQWLERLDEPMPVWAVLEMVLLVIDKLDPPYQCYD